MCCFGCVLDLCVWLIALHVSRCKKHPFTVERYICSYGNERKRSLMWKLLAIDLYVILVCNQLCSLAGCVLTNCG